ncbi:MAG: hypothetical protein UHS47_05705 [Oscillospiraceae bacterium]|jgi:hypothetical protein|nr:hypothetical protein [Oscillospiraceae bacterium]
MRQFTIRLRSFQDVQHFVTIAAAQNFTITVGSPEYHVSATSFMGMFTLDYTRPLECTAVCNDEQWAQFFEIARVYIVL